MNGNILLQIMEFLKGEEAEKELLAAMTNPYVR